MDDAEPKEHVGVICANLDCKVAITGRCVEGLELKTCTFFGKKPEIDGSKGMEGEAAENLIRLPSGTVFSLSEADRQLREKRSRVLAIIGPKDSGKSSLIAGVYDLMQEAKTDTMKFAGSLTLPALEQLCHDVRISSRRKSPEIQRTPHGEVTFYHLETVNSVTMERLALFLGDRAGEEYRSSGDDPTVARTFPEIRSADSVTVLVDGERMLDSGDRHILRNQILLTLTAMTETKSINAGVPLALVLTKIDCVIASSNSARVLEGFLRLKTDIESNFRKQIGPVSEFQVAASPKNDSVDRGAGLPALLSFWALSGRASQVEAPLVMEQERAFCRLSRTIETPGGQA